jgi:signal transduction histidine kinase
VAADVALGFALAEDIPLIDADETRLKQVLLNLLSNAIKFTPAGGHVMVSAWLEASGLVIAVADTGIGMRAQDIPLALEPFRQVDAVLSRRYEGTGLGLPLAKRLTELHGGTLEIDSMPGRGTTVRIRLPALRMIGTVAA